MKLTLMSKEQLQAYITKWMRNIRQYQQGSKNYRKCLFRIDRAKKLHSVL